LNDTYTQSNTDAKKRKINCQPVKGRRILCEHGTGEEESYHAANKYESVEFFLDRKDEQMDDSCSQQHDGKQIKKSHGPEKIFSDAGLLIHEKRRKCGKRPCREHGQSVLQRDHVFWLYPCAGKCIYLTDPLEKEIVEPNRICNPWRKNKQCNNESGYI